MICIYIYNSSISVVSYGMNPLGFTKQNSMGIRCPPVPSGALGPQKASTGSWTLSQQVEGWVLTKKWRLERQLGTPKVRFVRWFLSLEVVLISVNVAQQIRNHPQYHQEMGTIHLQNVEDCGGIFLGHITCGKGCIFHTDEQDFVLVSIEGSIPT